MSNKVEHRHITQEFRVSDEGEPLKIAGYASVFNTPYDVGYWTEEVDPNAFDSVLASDPDVRALWNHNSDQPLGRTKYANTLRLSIDSRGLAYEIDPPATSYANDLIVSMRRKDVTQSSFAFITKRDQWTENADGTVTRRILEFDTLLDVSPVTYPANPAASSNVRSLPETMPKEMRSRFEQRIDAPTEPAPVEPTARSIPDCFCTCSQCMAESCGICSADPQCAGAVRQMRMKLQLTASKK
jgi:uncharacterized protein